MDATFKYAIGNQTDSTPSSSARLKHTISNLVFEDIYAIQLNYEQNAQKVFSGRDVFVWPSKPSAEEGKLPIGKDERVATYPYFGHWPNKEYRYRICELTFPADIVLDGNGNLTPKREQWVSLINHAFEQWETATDGLVTMTRDTTACPITNVPFSFSASPPINTIVLEFPLPSVRLRINDVYMVNDSNLSNVQAQFTNFIGSGLAGRCIFYAPACTITKAYGQSAQASTQLSNAAGSNNGVDILFAKSSFSDKKLDIPNSINFNKCLRRNSDGNYIEDEGRYFPYKTALHEAGHALGTSGFSILDLGNVIDIGSRQWTGNAIRTALHKRAHPDIPDAVMNYDQRVPEISDEPDCSPHPFDILAIYALYQHVGDGDDE